MLTCPLSVISLSKPSRVSKTSRTDGALSKPERRSAKFLKSAANRCCSSLEQMNCRTGTSAKEAAHHCMVDLIWLLPPNAPHPHSPVAIISYPFVGTRAESDGNPDKMELIRDPELKAL